jgi:tetratricopeptide (TPR) repeat protein
LFLISPESVAPGSYALAELNLAKARWRHPGGHVLPVRVAPTPLEAIPAYLRAITLLDPQGDVVAETVAAVAAVRPPARRGRMFALLAGVALMVALAVAGYMQWQKRVAAEAHATALTTAAQQLCEAGDHALAWQRYDEAFARYPDRKPLHLARKVCGMRWLREIRVRVGKETFTDIVNRVLPVLAEGATAAGGQHLADLYAHMGWADYLRNREGAGRLDPEAHYRKALAVEPANIYAHAMWGHYIIARKPLTEEGKQHFAAAVAGGRERGFVRTLQFAALVEYGSFEGQLEALRVAGEMRRNGEAMDQARRDHLWRAVYASRLYMGDWRVQRPRFMAAFSDPEGPATFRWLYPEDQVSERNRDQWKFLLASLEQAAGEREAALARYEALRADLELRRASGTLLLASTEAIKQLQRP